MRYSRAIPENLYQTKSPERVIRGATATSPGFAPKPQRGRWGSNLQYDPWLKRPYSEFEQKGTKGTKNPSSSIPSFPSLPSVKWLGAEFGMATRLELPGILLSRRFLIRPLAVLVLFSALGGVHVHAQAPRPPKTVPPAAVLVDNETNHGAREFLEGKYPALKKRWSEWMRRADAFNFNFVGPKFTEGSAAAAAVVKEQAWLNAELEAYRNAADQFASDIANLDIDRERRIALMIALGERLKLGSAKMKEARSVMLGLRRDGNTSASPTVIAATWRTAAARNGDAAFAAAAAAGEGPTLFNSGTQSSFNDCTIFALASAMGRPYGLVAAEATQMLRDANWRGKADRDDPEGVIKREGLNGDEVTLLAAAFGQAQLVPSGDFAKTLREGRPVAVCVKLAEGESVYLHQVVLSRTFAHHGETWFEMIDSHLGNSQRRYLSEKELFTVLNENGLAYRADAGRTTAPLGF